MKIDFYSMFLYIIIFVKVGFLGSSIYYRVLKKRDPEDKKKIEKIMVLKEVTDFTFIGLMGVLLMVLFNPKFGDITKLTSETKFLLSLFGAVLLITADWEGFLKNLKKL